MDAKPAALDGWIADYWEQGMEEAPWLVFQDRAFTSGSSWERAGMHRLTAGGALTIFRADGTVLWSGVLRRRRLGLLGRFGPVTLTPADVDEATWASWFRRSPNLRASYRPPPPPPERPTKRRTPWARQ